MDNQTDSPTAGRDGADVALTIGALAVATLLGLAFDSFGMETCIVIAYVIAVQGIALATRRRIHCVLASALAVGLYNFFFTEPRHSLTALGAAYPATFAVMFAAALGSSYVAMTLHREAERTESAMRRSSVMLETNRLLQACADEEDIVRTAGIQLARLSRHATAWYQAEADGSLVAEWAFSPEGEVGPLSEVAPAMPPVLGGSAYLGMPLGDQYHEASARGIYLTVYDRGATAGDSSVRSVIGCLGINADEDSLTHDERNIAAAIAGETSLALGREAALLEREAEAVHAKNEQLRANLLRSISHDLRTPLTAITGNADVLCTPDILTPEQRRKLAQDIRKDAVWLDVTVENLLAITKLENGDMSLHKSVELLDDVIEEALRHVSANASAHDLEVEPSEDVALVNVDAHLTVQLVVNLVNNAVNHTPEGSHIRIRTWLADGWAHCSVTDDGPGVPEEDRERIFDSFYTTGRGLADSRRSVGLGLALCSSIAAAHGGTIEEHNVEPHGSCFEFRLPAVELAEEPAEDAAGDQAEAPAARSALLADEAGADVRESEYDYADE